MPNDTASKARLRRALKTLDRDSLFRKERKDEWIRFRVTEKEHYDIKNCAKELGLTVSGLLLQLFYHAKARL